MTATRSALPSRFTLLPPPSLLSFVPHYPNSLSTSTNSKAWPCACLPPLTVMNSLTYLSRQFDVLASPRTPPSTPSEERNSFLTDGGVRALQEDGTSDTSLKRVNTWSTKSFLFPPTQQSPGRSTPKRSHSSPADIITMAALAARSTTPTSSEVPIHSKSNVESLLRRIFFVRVFVVLWNAVCSAWASLTRRDTVRTTDTTVEEGTDADEKDETEDEAQNEKHVSLLSSQPPPLPPPVPSFPSPRSQDTPSIIPSLHRSETEPLFPSDSPGSVPSQSLSTSSSQSAVPSDSASRSTTPPFPARKTPFHLPKTLVLDLDETLIHSTSRPIFASGSGGSGLLGLGGFGKRNKGAGHVVEVVLGGRSTLYHVYKRPFVDYFLRKVCRHANTAFSTVNRRCSGLGMVYIGNIYCIYARVRGPCNRLARRWSWDPRTSFFPGCKCMSLGGISCTEGHCNKSCTQLPNGSYTKDLSIIEDDLSRVCLVDNSPISYRVNEGRSKFL